LERDNKKGPTTKEAVMLLKSWHWLEYDAIALVVLIASLAAVALLALSI
jgi:hypothetical protein